MSYFSIALSEILAENQWSQSDLAKFSNLDNGKISRWIADNTPIKPDDLERIAALLKSSDQQARLIIAHLRDECPKGHGGERIEIKLGSHAVPLLESATPPLAAGIERAFQVLRANAPSDTDLREILIHLAKLFEKE
jgi:transcriptional regulator with XRE-family HTH domain